jgi:hypothetical protein
MTQPNFRDVELISAYLDGQLSQAESTRLETRLKTNPQLRTVLDDLSQSRALLRKLPARRAPRNFTLTPKMAGVKPPVPRAFPLFRFASALAAILFFFSFTANQVLPALSGLGSAAPLPAYGIGGGPGEPAAAPAAAAAAEATSAPAATEAPAMQAPIAPAPTMSVQDNFALTPTPEDLRTMASVETETPPPTEAAPALEKISPKEPSTLVVSTPIPREVQPPVPLAVEMGLLVLAVLAGLAALFVRWQVDRKFSQIARRK